MYPYGVVVKKYHKGLAIVIGVISLIIGIIFLPIRFSFLYYLIYVPIWFQLPLLFIILLLGLIGALVYRGLQSPVPKATRTLLLVGGLLMGVDILIWFSPVGPYIWNNYGTYAGFVIGLLSLLGDILVIISAFLYLRSLKRFDRVLFAPQNPFIR